MGGGVASKHVMYSSLTPEMEAQFSVYEQECREKCLTVSESFEFLLAKYEQLYNSTNESQRRTYFKSNNGEILSPTDIVSIWMSQVNPENSPVNKKARDLLELDQKYRLDEIKKLDLSTDIDNHSKYLLGQVFSVEKPDEHYAGQKSKTTKDDEEATLVLESTYTHPVTGDTYTRYECSVCKIKFDSKSLIQTHISHSDIHAANVKQRAVLEAGRYRAMKQQLKFKASTVALIMKGFQKYKYNPSTMSVAKYRWKRALNWAICIRWKQIYYERTKKMCFVPNTVHVMFNGTKVFFRRNGTVTCKISMYLHTDAQALEVVPHILSVATNASESAEAAGQASSQEYFIALPRIYLNYNAMLGCMMGNVKPESGLLISTEAEKPNAHGRMPRRSASMDLSMENALATFVINHLKMAKPAKKSKTKGAKAGADGDTFDAESTPGASSGQVRRKSNGNVAPAVANTRKISFSNSGTSLVIPQDAPPTTSALNSAASSAAATYVSPRSDAIAAAATRKEDCISPPSADPAAGGSVNMVIKAKKETGRTKYKGTTPASSAGAVSSVGTSTQEGMSELDNILNHLNEYTISFDDTNLPTETPPIIEMPDDLIPIAAVCADQEYNIYEPTENK